MRRSGQQRRPQGVGRRVGVAIRAGQRNCGDGPPGYEGVLGIPATDGGVSYCEIDGRQET
jgi:hypothetical protein